MAWDTFLVPALGCLMNAHGTTSKTPGLDSIRCTAAHSHAFGEMPLRAVTKAAVFLPLQIFEEGLEPPWCRFVQLMAAKNDRIFCGIFFAFIVYFSHIFAYFDFPLHRIIPPPCLFSKFPTLFHHDPHILPVLFPFPLVLPLSFIVCIIAHPRPSPKYD